MTQKTSALLFGGTGLLGAPLALSLAQRGYRVFVAGRSARFRSQTSIESLRCDLTVEGAGDRLVRHIRPDWAINCAAITSVDACELDGVAARVNAEWPRELAIASASTGARCVHISTDSVFSRAAGQVAPEEDSARTPLNAYARQKALAEDLVADASHGEALVVRTNFFGWSRAPGRGLAAWGLQELRGGRRIQGFTDVFFNPLYVGDVIDMLIGLLERDIRGTVHVLGSQCLSKFSFLRKLATAFWLDPELVEERRLRDAGLAAPRPLNTCLSTRQLEECLGSPPPNVDEGLDRMVQDEEPLRAKLMNVEAYPGEGEG